MSARERTRPTAAWLWLLVPALAIVLPAVSGDTSVAAALVLPLLAAGLCAAALAFVLVTVLRAAQEPAPVRIRAHRATTPDPDRVDLRGRPEHPRAPGCGF